MKYNKQYFLKQEHLLQNKQNNQEKDKFIKLESIIVIATLFVLAGSKFLESLLS